MNTNDGVQVVVLTALQLEYDAVRAHLADLVRRSDPAGTQFEVGTLGGGRVAIAEVGPGNLDAALIATHAIALFQPEAVLFVGVAGALDDKLELGAVVVATRVFAVHGGKEYDDQFRARPRSFDADHELLQRARFVARQFQRPQEAPAVYFKPVAAGEVVLNSRTRPLAQQLSEHYNDAAAIEMESAGMAWAAHVGRVRVLTIRGISDKADGQKTAADANGSQPAAAKNAADLAAMVITDFFAQPERSSDARSGDLTSAQPVTAMSRGIAVGAGNIRPQNAQASTSVDWQPVSPAPALVWRSELINRYQASERSALEVHLVPVLQPPSIEVRRLRELREQLARMLPVGIELNHNSDDRMVWAYTADYRLGPLGLVITRSGQRSAWEPLPSDTLGAVLDEGWLIDSIKRQITSLTGLDLPPVLRCAPAVAVDPAVMLSIGRLDSLPRSSASMGYRQEPLRVPAHESVPFEQLTSLADGVAAELAARLLAAYGRRHS